MGTWSLSSGPGAVRESHAPGSLPELALLEKLLRAPYLVEMKVVGSREGAQRGERGPRRSTAAGTAGTCWEPWDRAKEEGRLPPLIPERCSWRLPFYSCVWALRREELHGVRGAGIRSVSPRREGAGEVRGRLHPIPPRTQVLGLLFPRRGSVLQNRDGGKKSCASRSLGTMNEITLF